jgi:D-ribose pyranase
MKVNKMKKTGILNKDISEVIASMGHLEILTVCDAGLPIPESVKRIDLAVTQGIPRFLDVITAIEKELFVQQIIITNELKETNPEFDEKIRSIFQNVEITYITHTEFKELSLKSKAIVRTCEFTPYANLMFVSGVVF